MSNKPLVLILGAGSGPTRDVAQAIAEKGGDRVEVRYTTSPREAQRLSRQMEFVAIVAPMSGFMGFCIEMVPHLTSIGNPLDVIVAVLDDDINPCTWIGPTASPSSSRSRPRPTTSGWP